MVQMELIALFLDHNLDEIIAARPAAGYLHRNPIERCEGKLKLNVDCGKALFFLRFPKRCVFTVVLLGAIQKVCHRPRGEGG